jgi:hypothetical protein
MFRAGGADGMILARQNLGSGRNATARCVQAPGAALQKSVMAGLDRPFIFDMAGGSRAGFY